MLRQVLLICLLYIGTAMRFEDIYPNNELLPITLKPPIVILVMGCNLSEILEDRIASALEFAKEQPEDQSIIWFLSGGVKHQINSMITSEAVTMSKKITENPRWKIQLDTIATNTAENFAMFRKWVEIQPSSDIYIVTSEFHYERASIIYNGIINVQTKWILSPKTCLYCKSDENVHSMNINSDIKKGLFLYDKL